MTDQETLRERRRARILNNSEDRLNKLLGYKKRHDDTSQPASVAEAEPAGSNSFNIRPAEHFTTGSYSINKTQMNEVESFIRDNSNGEATLSNPGMGMPAEGFHVTSNKDSDTNIEEDDDKSNNIIRLRYMTMLALGFLVRLILESPLKIIIFQENILFQFILVQAMFLGFQKKPNEEPDGTSSYGINFICLKLLQFIGIPEGWLKRFKRVSSVSCAIATDLCIFMFSFIFIHFCIG